MLHNLAHNNNMRHAYQLNNNIDNMCSLSSDNLHRRRRSHNNNCKQQMKQHKLFDDSRKFLHKTQKFITADLCQIVDGQNYQSYRHATASKMEMMNKSCNDKYYQPVSSRGSSGGSMKQSTSSATLSTAESSSYTTCDQLDVSQRSVSLSPPHMLDWLRSTTVKKQQQQQQDRDRSSQSSLPDLEAIRRRRVSSNSSSKQRRRHSLQEPARISAARRLSGQSTSSESSRVRLLHASKPMHRTLSNQDISGILRPARYSSTNLADMAAGYEPGDSSPLIRREINRISNDMKKASLLAATSSHRLDFRSVRSLTRRSTTASTSQLPTKSRPAQQQTGRSLSRMNSCKPNPLHNMGEEKNADWVASGVNFSQNMEVFVFQKR